MTGTRADAEDLVQEAYIRWHEADRARIENPEAWLLRRRDRLVHQLGIDLGRVQALLDQRAAARASKDYAASDRLRGELQQLGVEVKDTPKGQVWRVLLPSGGVQ